MVVVVVVAVEFPVRVEVALGVFAVVVVEVAGQEQVEGRVVG